MVKIVSLRAENVKRLSAVEITPDAALVEVTGRNAAGKSSTLDSIWYALGGKRVIPSSPIRRGQEEASVVLNLGDLKVTRTFNAQEDGDFTTYLKVENRDGATFSKPQDLLDAMVGDFTFDPMEFITRCKPAEQVEVLKRFVPDFDFAADEASYRADYASRTEANRLAKESRAKAATIQVPEDAPDTLADVSAIMTELRDAGSTNAEIQSQRLARQREASDIAEQSARALALYNEADALRRRAGEMDAEAGRLSEGAVSRTVQLQALPALPELADTADLTARLEAAQRLNVAHQQWAERRNLVLAAERKEATSKLLTEALESRVAARAKAVAEANMPVPGLGFGEGEVTLNGLPFDQASGAEQLRASVAIAAALNPKLRIAFVRDASRLDSDSMAALADFAAEHDIQVWAESVESGRPSAIVIEDGRIAQPQLMAAE